MAAEDGQTRVDLAMVAARLDAIEKRMDRQEEANQRRADRQDNDVRELTRTVVELSKAIAGLAAKVAVAPGIGQASPAPQQVNGATVGASGGLALLGAVLGSKLASWLGISAP